MTAAPGALEDRVLQLAARRTTLDNFTSTSTTDVLTIEHRNGRGLRVQFTIEKSNGSEPNKADVIVTNAAASTRQHLCRSPLRYDLSAGYQDNPRLLYVGDLRHGYSTPVGTEWETRVQLGDGDRAYRFARVDRSYPPGTNYLTAVRDAARTMGLALPPNIEASAELLRAFNAGIAMSGSARDELTALLGPFGYTWSIQNGRLQILKPNETAANALRRIAQDTGMVESPEWQTPEKGNKPQKCTIKTVLYPELVPGGRVEVQSRTANGIMRIEKVTHTGDTHGDDWFTTIEAKPV